jgi:acyl carrier protein
MLFGSPMESVKSQLKLIIARGLRLPDEAVENFGDDQRLMGGDLEIDSIDILQIILEIERHFGIKLVTGKFEAEVWATIGSLAAAVESKLAAAGKV